MELKQFFQVLLNTLLLSFVFPLFIDILNKVSVIYGFNFGILLDGPCCEVCCHVPLSVTLTNFMSNRPEKLDRKVKYLNLTISMVKVHTLPNSINTVQSWRDVSRE